MSELKPCPFCGGEAEFETYGGTACAVVCQSCRCGTPTMSLTDGMAAVNRWNRRAERTCHYVPEMTEARFNDDDEEIETGIPAEECDCFECSECGFPMMYGDIGWFDAEPPYKPHFSYCPNCGAKVVDE